MSRHVSGPESTRGVETSEWVEFEQKVPDQVPAGGGQGALTTTMKVGKGRRARKLKVTIPRSMIAEVKRK